MTSRGIFIFLTFIICFTACPTFAGWEDVGARSTQPAVAASPAVRPTPSVAHTKSVPQHQTPAVQNRTAVSEGMKHIESDPDTSVMPPDLYSVFIDSMSESDSWYKFTFISDAYIGDSTTESLSSGEVAGHFALFDFQNCIGGDLAFSLDLKFSFYTEDGGFEFMPDLLTECSLDIEWIWRFVNGWSFEFGARPGIFCETDGLGGNMYGYPVRGCFYYTMSPSTSVRFGVEVRPGWDMVAMPLVGIAWQPVDLIRFELGVPRALIDMRFGAIGIFGKAEWENTTYGMSGDPGEPDDLTIEQWKLGGGLSIAFTDSCHIAFEAGIVTGRTLTLDGNAGDDELSLDDAPYYVVLFGSEF